MHGGKEIAMEHEIRDAWRTVDRNRIAALLSILPGLGHLYKHHYVAGLGILIGGNILVGFVAVLMILGTFGLSVIVVPLAYVAGIATAAYKLPDWHGHHRMLHPWRKDQA
jgi:hypothetical protein